MTDQGYSNEENPIPPQPQERPIFSVSEMLTPSELAQLEQAGREADAYLRKVYPNLKFAQDSR